MGRDRRKADWELAHDAAVAEARSRCSDPELLSWPATAAEARRLGVNKFFNGVPCAPKGHVCLRRAGDSTCIRCSVERVVEHRRWKREEARQAAWGGDCPWPATLREARRIGAEYYFTGVACGEGHIQIRETASQRCTDCPTSADRSRHRHRQRMVEESTEEVLAEQAAYSRERYWRDPQKERQRSQALRAAGVKSGSRMWKLRTPPWQTAEEAAAIEAFYANCPAGQEVDHIFPIDHRKRLVGGLHVLANLQYRKPRQNVLKEIGRVITLDEARQAVAAGVAVWSEHIDARGNVMWTHYS